MAFEIGNKYAQEWTLENALPRFEDALKYAAENDECLCLQDAKFISAIPSRTFDYLVDNHDVLRLIKQDIMDHIVARVNKLAIKDLAPASPAIWRMKQLGERDEQHINQTGTMKQEITVTDKETAKEIEDLKAKFEAE
jgi:hypothetical protein